MLDYKIHTFLTLCECMNYRITAERLNMTQPAVTNHIKQLETEYCCKLFSYTNRTLAKTNAAVLLEEYARSADYNANLIKVKLSAKERITLKIGATKTIGEYIINSKLKRLPLDEIDLLYIVDNTERLISKLKNGELDFVFIEGFIDKSEFTSYLYKTEELVGICSKSHEFAGKAVPIEEIFGERIILREQGSGTREAFERILEEKNCTLARFGSTIESSSFKAITELVGEGVGISFAYKSVVSDAGVASFRIEGIMREHEFVCVQLKNVAMSPFKEVFLGD